jgi:N-acetyl sugar amidotransferase
MGYQICTRCIMDTTDPQIVFDENGVCNHCTAALERMRQQLLPPEERARALAAIVAEIKEEGKGRDYDCIIGVSGGVDSSMVAYTAKQHGLRPLAVHLDNGWNSELAVDNIKRVLDHMGIELYTHVIDWEEFKDLQLSFLKSSVPNCEIPTDHAIGALLFQMAARHGTRFILSGSNLATEAIMPLSWGHYNQDLKHLKAVHRRFGRRPLRTLPKISLPDYLYYVFVKRIRQIPFLNYMDYRRSDAKRLLEQDFGWRDYGGKHYESVWTRFFQGHYLPTKFGFDKRKAHESSMICSGLVTREQALATMEEPIYDPALLKQDLEFVVKKFGLTPEEWEEIMRAPPRSHLDYPGHHILLYRMDPLRRMFRKAATASGRRA